MDFATKAIHVGQQPDPATGATIVPIYETSTYTQRSPGEHQGFDYSRTINPTRLALERCLASLENGTHGLCFASGMAAISAALNLLSSGDHVVVTDDLYGGTFRLFERVLTRYGLSFTYVDASRPEAIRRALTGATRLLWLETPTNPLMKLADIRAAVEVCAPAGVLVAVDNTFATPYLQNPLDLGAHIVVHSTTKYIGGHSDAVGGCVVTNRDDLYATIKFHQNSVGAVPSPFDCFLMLRGVKTLAVRMAAHEHNARAIADFLAARSDVEAVYYPGLASHAQHALAKRQMRGFGGMLSFVPKGGVERAKKIAASTKLFALAESLGGVESLICHPVFMTHGSIPKEERQAHGLPDALLRLSVGIESAQDLIADLGQALEA
jgi:cystathionine beta-lyase/cystathionine gamma-synthase